MCRKKHLTIDVTYYEDSKTWSALVVGENGSGGWTLLDEDSFDSWKALSVVVASWTAWLKEPTAAPS